MEIDRYLGRIKQREMHLPHPYKSFLFVTRTKHYVYPYKCLLGIWIH